MDFWKEKKKLWLKKKKKFLTQTLFKHQLLIFSSFSASLYPVPHRLSHLRCRFPRECSLRSFGLMGTDPKFVHQLDQQLSGEAPVPLLSARQTKVRTTRHCVAVSRSRLLPDSNSDQNPGKWCEPAALHLLDCLSIYVICCGNTMCCNAATEVSTLTGRVLFKFDRVLVLMISFPHFNDLGPHW